MDKKEADYLNFKDDFDSGNISFKQRVDNPYFYYQFALEQLNKLNCLSVLDVGCADGVFSKMCIKQGLTAYGVDASRTARKEYEAQTNSAAHEKIANFENQFDAVVLLEMLEHAEDPDLLLNQAWHAAKKMVIFTVPIKDSLKCKFHINKFDFYDVFNMTSPLTNNFKIFSINKMQKLGNPLNIFATVLYK